VIEPADPSQKRDNGDEHEGVAFDILHLSVLSIGRCICPF
jgi:hypothetical protein